MTRWGAAIGRVAMLVPDRIGRRGTVLLTAGVADIVYGIALLRPTAAPELSWWPASVGQLGGVPLHVWGVVWIVAGVFVLTGVSRRRTDWPQYAVEVGLTAGWAFEAAVYSFATRPFDVWGPVVVYTALALILVIVSGWEEPRRPS
jgi:hypothetical protein